MEVDFSFYTGGGSLFEWIEQGCAAAKVPFSGYWLRGMETLIGRESSIRPNAVNKWDSNAHGVVQADGAPLNCSRGLCQVIPSTFAAYHAETTKNQIYDPVANIAASINYIRSRYNVNESGFDLSEKVQQADPNRPPRGY